MQFFFYIMLMVKNNAHIWNNNNGIDKQCGCSISICSHLLLYLKCSSEACFLMKGEKKKNALSILNWFDISLSLHVGGYPNIIFMLIEMSGCNIVAHICRKMEVWNEACVPLTSNIFELVMQILGVSDVSLSPLISPSICRIWSRRQATIICWRYLPLCLQTLQWKYYGTTVWPKVLPRWQNWLWVVLWFWRWTANSVFHQKWQGSKCWNVSLYSS